MESMLYDHLGGIKVHESFTFKDGKNKGKLLKIVGTFKSPDGWMHYVKNLETNKITERNITTK